MEKFSRSGCGWEVSPAGDELETELPLVVGELGHRYDRQEFRLSLMTWIAAIFAVGIGLIFLVGT